MEASAQQAALVPEGGTIKETLEAILVAFILAFIFRAFVIEAFVIPTGSMAPTLMGAHMRFRCPDCGYSFDVNYSTDHEGDDMNIPSAAGPLMVTQTQIVNGQPQEVSRFQHKNYAIYCPNCGYKIDRENPADAEDSAQDPPVYYGDRILVMKYLYLVQPPHRWDVVVFKNPNDPTQHYDVNYIKRLIGKPGETVMIVDGDVYIADTASPQLSDFVIQTKPRYAQEALWRIVFNNDFYPTGRDRENGLKWVQPWQNEPDGSGWDLGGPHAEQRIFSFDNATGSAAIRFNPLANPDQQALTDWIAYDVTINQGNSGPTDPSPEYLHNTSPTQTYVSDLKLAFFYQRRSGDGPLRLQLTKRDDRFTAEIYSDHVLLLRSHAGGADMVIAQSTAVPAAGHLMHVEFSNVDYRVTLRIDNKDIIQTTPDDYRPDLPALLSDYRAGRQPPAPVVRIEGQRQSSVLSHISLWRDIYYTSDSPDRYRSGIYWAMPDNFPAQLAHLGPDEYFVMGDNSLISQDARYWRSRVDLPDEDLSCQSGRVPGRFMLGKAFFVYWPAGFRPVSSSPALVPNFGDMRLIH